MVLIASGLHPTTLETPKEKELPFLCDSNGLLYGNFINPTCLIAYPRGSLYGQSDGCFVSSGLDLVLTTEWGVGAYSFKPPELSVSNTRVLGWLSR